MGALCGKESGSSSTPAGRVLGSAPSNGPITSTSTPYKANKKPKVGGPARTLGGESPGPDGADPRAAAARAAEARNAQRPTAGKIASELDKQKRKTNQHLIGASENQRLNECRQRQEILAYN